MNTTSVVKLVDRRLRIVEVDGPRPVEWRTPTLKLDNYVNDQQLPQTVGFCVKAGRTSQFLIDKSPAGDQLLARIAKAPAKAETYGRGWVIR